MTHLRKIKPLILLSVFFILSHHAFASGPLCASGYEISGYNGTYSYVGTFHGSSGDAPYWRIDTSHYLYSPTGVPNLIVGGSWWLAPDTNGSSYDFYRNVNEYGPTTTVSGLYNQAIGGVSNGTVVDGSCSSPTPTATGTSYLPATLDSQQQINNPVSTSTYSFYATATSTRNTHTAGVIYITHTSTTTPTITWGGVSMVKFLDSDDTNGYTTSLFKLNGARALSAIVVSGIAASSTRVINESIWINADNTSASSTATSGFGVSQLTLDLSSEQNPVAGSVYLYTTDPNQYFHPYSFNKYLWVSSSSSFSSQVVRGVCPGSCDMGYSVDYFLPAYFNFSNTHVVGLNLYATGTLTISTSSAYAPPESISEPVFPTIDTTVYNSCDTFDVICFGRMTLGLLFGYDSDSVSNYIVYLKYVVLTRFPIGYVTDIYNIMSTTTEGTLTVIDATLPSAFPFFENQHVHLDLAHSIDFVLYATTSQFTNASASSTDTLLDITEYYWRILLYAGVIGYMIYRVFPNQKKHL